MKRGGSSVITRLPVHESLFTLMTINHLIAVRVSNKQDLPGVTTVPELMLAP